MPIAAYGYVGAYAASNVTTMNVGMPTGLADGQRLIIMAAGNGTTTLSTTSTGWTKINQSVGGSGTLASTLAVFAGVAGVAANPFVLRSSVGAQMTAYTLSINGADNSVTPLLGFSTATSGQINPPALALSPAGEYLVLAVGTSTYGEYRPTGAPSGYSGPYSGQSATGISGTNVAFGFAVVTGSTVDPGAFSGMTSTSWVGATVAVKAAPVATRRRGSFAHLVGAA